MRCQSRGLKKLGLVHSYLRIFSLLLLEIISLLANSIILFKDTFVILVMYVLHLF